MLVRESQEEMGCLKGKENFILCLASMFDYVFLLWLKSAVLTAWELEVFILSLRKEIQCLYNCFPV